MRIAIIDMDNLKNPFWAAGQARATYEVGKILARRHSVTVYCSKYPGYRDYAKSGVRYRHVGLVTKNRYLTNLGFIFSIPRLVGTIQAEVILENFHVPFSVSLAPLLTSTPVVGLPAMFNATEFTRKYHLPFHWVETIGARWYRYFLPYSKTGEQKMKSLNPGIISKIVPQGVGEEYFQIPHRGNRHILFLGRFDIRQKGIDLLLRAYRRVAARIPYPLTIAGHGPDERTIRRLINNLHLTDRVSIVGPLYGQKKKRAMSDAVCVAFPSRYDEMSLWTLEALAAGLPIVGFRLPESRWLTRSVSTLVQPFDVAAYAIALLTRTRRGYTSSERRTCQVFAKRFTWDRVAHEFESFFQTVLHHEHTRFTRHVS